MKDFFTKKILPSLFLLVLFSTACSVKDSNSWVYDNVEFDMPIVREPVIPANSINIADLGAVADGQTLNTHIFEEAIDKMYSMGGGSVVVPAGLWLTGPIVLKSNINIHLEDGALVRFSGDYDLYPIVESAFEGKLVYRCQSPISGFDLTNISLTGKGVFDGSGDAWRPVKRFKMTDRQWRNLINSGGVVIDNGAYWFPTEKAAKGHLMSRSSNLPQLDSYEEFLEIKDFLRPVMVSLISCKKVLLDGLTFQNSPAWNIHPLMCEDLSIRNLTVRNPWYSQNGDGLDLESCKNVLVYNNNFDVGDDAICLKSGRDKEGRDRGIPTENVIIKNNIVYHGHGGFVIGSEMSGGVRNIHVSDCTFMGTDIGVRFKSTRRRGGVVENIYISNINMIDIPTEPIRFNMFYEGRAPILDDTTGVRNIAEAVPVDEGTPLFRNIYVRDIVADGQGNAALFMGLPELKLENIKLENVILKAPKGFSMIDVKGVELINVKVINSLGPALTIFNGNNIDIQGFSYDDDLSFPALAVSGASSNDIAVSKEDFTDVDENIYFTGGANQSAVNFK